MDRSLKAWEQGLVCHDLVLKSLLTDSDRKHEHFEAIENKLQEVNLVVQKQLKAIKVLQAAMRELTERNAGQVRQIQETDRLINHH